MKRERTEGRETMGWTCYRSLRWKPSFVVTPRCLRRWVGYGGGANAGLRREEGGILLLDGGVDGALR